MDAAGSWERGNGGVGRGRGVLRTILSNLRFAPKCNKKPLNCQTEK